MSYKMEAARRAATLVLMLEDFELEPWPAHIVYAERKPMPLKLRAFVDWVTPRLNGLKYFEKPPLQYWATALAYEEMRDEDIVEVTLDGDASGAFGERGT